MGDFSAAEQFVFGGDVLAYHSTRFANVDLVRPVAVVDKFILGQAPAVHLGLDLVWNAGIVGDEIHQTFLVGLVFRYDFPTSLVTGFGIVVVLSGIGFS